MLKNLCNVHFFSSTNNPATIQCDPNVDRTPNFDTGLAFIAVRNLTIEYLTIIGCGMRHVSTSYSTNDTKRNLIVFNSALYNIIQNSTNIFLNNVSISDSDGLGLCFYDTNGIVTIANSFFIHNFLRNKNSTVEFGDGGGGVYIEFTKCTPGVTTCDPHSNLHNSHSRYIHD